MRPERAYSPAARASEAPDPSRVLVIGCGALARELVAVIDQAGLTNVDLTCLPATLHNRPGGIPAAVQAKIRAARPRYENIFIAYADCGTGGVLDRVLAEEAVERLPGAHCYEFFSGSPAFGAMMDEEPGTFFLTDFLARNFDRLVWVGLGLDRHPDLLPVYFGAYKRVVYLAQTEDPALVVAARRAARRLGLAFEMRQTGYGDLATAVVNAAGRATVGSIAPGVTNVGRQPSAPPERVETLRDTEEVGTSDRGSESNLHGMQEGGARRRPLRRWLRPVQASARSLHDAQESSKEPATSSRGRATQARAADGRATHGRD